MGSDSSGYTLTMAQVYAAQGHWDKAAEIYRHLVQAQPEREDLKNALAAAEQQLKAGSARRLDDLAPLLRTWFELNTRLDRLRRLEQMRGRMGQG